MFGSKSKIFRYVRIWKVYYLCTLKIKRRREGECGRKRRERRGIIFKRRKIGSE